MDLKNIYILNIDEGYNHFWSKLCQEFIFVLNFALAESLQLDVSGHNWTLDLLFTIRKTRLTVV